MRLGDKIPATDGDGDEYGYGGGLTVVSRVKLTVKLSIPTLLLPPFVPVGPFERSGSESLQKLLDRDMGTVLGRFREGYLTWATGD